MARFIYVDGNSIGHASQRTTKLTVGGREVQAVFQFIKSLRKQMASANNAIGPTHMMVLWDGHAAWRYEILPEYKSGRNADPKAVEEKRKYKEQLPLIHKALEHLGVTQVLGHDVEADDLAGYFTRKAVKEGHEVVLQSGDQDWIQLVCDRCVWIDPIRDRTVSMSNFAEATGVADANQFVEKKALTGDSSDSISGVGGIGEQGASDFLLQYGSVAGFFKAARDNKLPAKLPVSHKRLLSRKPFEYRGKQLPPMIDTYVRNIQLMDLRRVPPPDPTRVDVTRGSFDPQKFAELCEELAFHSILNQFDTWIEPFKQRGKSNA